MEEYEIREIFAQNLTRYMEREGLKQVDLARILNIDESTVGKWLHLRSTPRMGVVEKLAMYFGINKSDLLERKPAVNFGRQKSNVIRLPVLGDIAGGVPIDALTQTIDPNDPDSWEEIPASWGSGGKEFLALKVNGDSMEPRIADGDIAILEHCYDFVNGAVMAVYVNGYKATLKKVRIMPNGILMLEAFNPNHESKVFTPEEVKKIPVKPLGILIETRAKWH